jgi:hypothetical protein
MVLIEAAADDPWRVTPGNPPVRSSTLVTGKPIPEAKTSDPLKVDEIPQRIVTAIESQARDLSAHANDPPRDKLPADAQRMRTWSYAQLKMHVTNDNPVEAEEFALLRAQRARPEPAMGDMPLVVLSRGIPDDSSSDGKVREQEHQQEQAALLALSRRAKQITAARSGHHVPLDQPDLMIAEIRGLMQSLR